MGDVVWTREQRQAIETVGGTVVVSAAAGSGKTAVLVERVIGLLTNGDRPIPPERLLIVTFTRAAAAEMKRKLKQALRERAVSDKNAEAALLKLDRAVISTMDAFCVRIVRENFERVGIAPDFRMMDDSELAEMERRAIEQTLERFYADGGAEFHALSRQFMSGYSDDRLADCIMRVYDAAQAYPDPAQWLEGIRTQYRTLRPAGETLWGAYLKQNLERALSYCVMLLRTAQDCAAQDADVDADYGPAVARDTERYEAALLAVQNASAWDAIAAAVAGLGKLTVLGRKYGAGKKPEGEKVKELRKKVQGILAEAAAAFSTPDAVHQKDAARLRPLMEQLLDCVRAYGERLTEIKHAANAYYFSDILHFSLSLFYEDRDGAPSETELCRKIAASYDAVLIDEYQDTTRAQDALFRAVSDDGQKLFVVGDVKQSIYSFRHATPEIFNERCAHAFAPEAGRFPARVILGKNFRSRAGILDFVNFVFAQIMTPEAGGLVYDASEYLYYGGGEPGALQDVQVVLTEAQEDPFAAEAEQIAAYIGDTVASGQRITIKGEERAVKFSDFCILLRSAKDRAPRIAETLRERQIPVVFETKTDTFSMPEAEALFALLRVTENPRSDVDLLSVMFFPLFGFTPDELAKIRLADRGRLYACVVAVSETGEDAALRKKCADFIAALAKYRTYSVSMRAADFVRYMIYETDFAAMVLAMPGGAERLAALEAFVDYAAVYEKNGASGYSGFLRYLDGVSRSGAETAAAQTFGDIENAVTIMTVHKSKGLEYPYVLIADTDKKFNTKDASADVICDDTFGAAIHLQERMEMKRYETLPFFAVKTKKKTAETSEEIRLLYVALTRAAYRLVIFGTVKNLEKTLRNAASLLPPAGAPAPYAILRSNTWLTMLLAALLRHPDCGQLRALADAVCDVRPCASHVELLCAAAPAPAEPSGETTQSEARQPFSSQTYDEIRRRIDYVYPYAVLQNLPAKITASGFAEGDVEYTDAALDQPSFVASGEGGAARGTAYHKFLYACDFAAARRNPARERQRLVETGRLSSREAEMIDLRKITAFFDSALGEKILSAARVYRELAFRLLLPAYEVYPEIPSAEKILVQGVADLVFFDGDNAVIVDYKTDMRADGAYLAQRYRRQVHIYKKAVEQLFGVTVARTALYSLSASQCIEV